MKSQQEDNSRWQMARKSVKSANQNPYLHGKYAQFLIGFDTIGEKKRLLKVVKIKKFRKLKPWIGSIINHMYWVAISSQSPVEREEKWLSLLNHIVDVHVHNENKLFMKCTHETIERKWLQTEYIQTVQEECLKLRNDFSTLKKAISHSKELLPEEPVTLVEKYLDGKQPKPALPGVDEDKNAPQDDANVKMNFASVSLLAVVKEACKNV
ncbi:Hypothetical predicted protein [Paramuricea clavata]|uniref:Uncharacterized protein n=1 Tax=Paramuricea clavata TaxID=317549 RepID=A0A7D9EU33_PARCT|nr:Hypothetical predicted protein [Paramuricea clavata]